MTFPKDPKLNDIYIEITEKFGQIELIQPSPPELYFQDLCENIIGQQLSTKVAKTITLRFRDLFSNGILTPEQVASINTEVARGTGISYSKVSYMKNIAQAHLSGSLDFSKLTDMSDEEIIEKLIQIKGIGQWTAEMFLIFTVGRKDVFSPGDGGLKRAMIKIYGLDEKVRPKELTIISESWSPNRTLASLVLWKSLEL